MRRGRRGATGIVVALAMILASGACGGDGTGPETPPSVSGSWTGTSTGVTLNLTLSEGIGGGVSGSGNIEGGDVNLALTVRQGSHVGSDLTLVLGAFGYEDINFVGRMGTEGAMAGTLNGSGFDGFDLNLARR